MDLRDASASKNCCIIAHGSDKQESFLVFLKVKDCFEFPPFSCGGPIPSRVLHISTLSGISSLTVVAEGFTLCLHSPGFNPRTGPFGSGGSPLTV